MKANYRIKSVLICLLALFILSFLSSCTGANHKAYTKDEALKMFNDNRQAFDDVAKILTSNVKFFDSENVSRGGATSGQGVEITHNNAGQYKKYFSQQEWDEIVNLFKKAHLESIDLREQNAAQFGYKYSDGMWGITFYYFTGSEVDITYYSQWCAHFDKLSDNWYVGYGDVPFNK